MLIVLSGLPGTGKSALSQQLGEQLSIPVFSVDPIESAILRAGVARSSETGLAAYLVVEALAEAELALGRSVIVDAVNAVEPAKNTWRKLAARFPPLRVIECHCSDPKLHRARLEDRRRGLALPEPTWDDVQRRRATTTAWSEPVLQLDAVAPLSKNVLRALAWVGPVHQVER